MKKDKDQLPLEIYHEKLQTIRDLKFSPRQVDIVACILHGRKPSKIAEILSINPKTIETHIRKILEKLTNKRGNSREVIIDFIEKSDKYQAVKDYYSALLIQHEFEKILLQLSKILISKGMFFSLVCGQDQVKSPWVASLEKHLALMGLKKKDISIKVDFVDMLIVWGLSSETSHKPGNIFTFPNEKDYYLTFFEFLKKFLPSEKLDKLLMEFKTTRQNFKKHKTEEHHRSILSPELSTSPPQALPHRGRSSSYKLWVLSGIVLVLFTLGGTLYSLFSKDRFSPPLIARSDLNIPKEDVLLNRAKLLNEIDKKLNEQKGIQSIALIGIGGAGKTTLARQYARSQNTSILWEINAETLESLKSAFESLAYSLAKTEEDNKILTNLQEIPDPRRKEEKVLAFVKERLKKQPDWLLIFDNVEKFSDIQTYFPHNIETWGYGKILITTRNNHLQENSQIKDSFHLGDLSPQEQLELYQKVMKQGKNNSLILIKDAELKKFLTKIPPFPLDVSVAAHYLKITGITYDEYLNNLNKNDNTFNSIQENILKETNDYSKTRFNIITLSLNHIIASHKDFKDLLLFISFLDSQNIPKNLLNTYKDKKIVDDFIFHLSKYSLITHEFPPSLSTTFSIHRNTQEFSLLYLTKSLKIEKSIPTISLIATTFEHYLRNAIDQDNAHEMKLLVSHSERLLSHHDYISDLHRAKIAGELGGIYFYLCDYDKAKKILENALSIRNRNLNKNDEQSGRAIVHLANVYKFQDNFKMAQELYLKAIELLKNQKASNTIDAAHAFFHLGELHKFIGEYKQAKTLLTKSLDIYKKKLPADSSTIAKVMSVLGLVHLYCGAYEEAQPLLDSSLQIYRKHADNRLSLALAFSNMANYHSHLGDYKTALAFLKQSRSIFNDDPSHLVSTWIVGDLGVLYMRTGNYHQARELLEKSLDMHKKFFPTKEHNYRASISFHLGRVYSELREHKKARKIIFEAEKNYRGLFPPEGSRNVDLHLTLGIYYMNRGQRKEALGALKKALEICAHSFTSNHNETAEVLTILGKVYLLEGDLKNGEEYLNKALNIYQKLKNSDVYSVFESLSELYTKKLVNLQSVNHQKQSQKDKEIALNYLNQAYAFVKKYFPEDSPHIKRIAVKIRALQGN